MNRSYLARLVAKGLPETTTRDDGRLVQYLVGHKDEQEKWRVAADELDRFMAGRVSARVVPAYDLAVRPPKSVSILHALGTLVPPGELVARGLPADLAGEVLAAHHAAVDDAIAVLERHAAWIRGKGGRVQAVGFTIAAFDHRSSRMGDPLLHTHLVVANVARGVDGRMAALDGTALYAWARPAGFVYQARLRAELTRRLGVEFHEPHNGVADLVGVPRAVIDLFSQRSAQRDALLAALGRSGAGAAQGAILATRPAKGVHAHQSPEQLAKRAARVGFTSADLVRHVLGRARPQAVSAQRLGEVAAELAGPEGLTARSTRVDLRDALCGFATALPQGASAEQIETWASRLLHDEHRFVPVAAAAPARSEQIRRGDGKVVRAGGTGASFTTPELLAHEARLVAAHDDGLGAGVGVVAGTHLEAALAARPTLRAEQAAMVEAITTSGHGVEVVVGGPGTGKTHGLGAAAAAWRASGYRVLGACLQGGAAEVLGIEADLDDQFTLARLLSECKRFGPGYLAGAVVVVDECGMADTRQLSRLAAWAGDAGSKVVLVGDPDQIPEVGAGGAFAHLVQRCGDAVVALRENHRQRDPADRDRLDLIPSGWFSLNSEALIAAGVLQRVQPRAMAVARCTVPGCGRERLRRTWCLAHENRWRRAGRPDPTTWEATEQARIPLGPPPPQCAATSCPREAQHGRLCGTHVQRWRAAGTPAIEEWATSERQWRPLEGGTSALLETSQRSAPWPTTSSGGWRTQRTASRCAQQPPASSPNTQVQSRRRLEG